jgi:hypothetical protein
MSDVTVAPPSAAPSSPAPASNEVPINQNPVSSPNPIGSQAPPAPVTDHKGSEHRTPSRAEALKAAYDRAANPPKTKPAEKPAQPAAEAKKGHNNPPEETPKLDLKKRPEEQPRDKGRFAPKQPEGNAEWQDLAKPRSQQQSGQPYKKLEPHEPFPEPPSRMAEHGKRDWANTPETVRGEVHRMRNEYEKAAQYYQGVAEAYKPIAHFDRMAREQGTTLEKAVSNYVGIEQRLRADPIAGLETIVHNLGLTDPQTNRRISLRDVAYHVLNQSPEQLRQVQQGNQQQAAAHQIGSLYNEVRGLKQTLNQWQTAQRFTQTRSAVDVFAESHPRFDELGDLIERELRLGFPLDQAYQRAELLRPAAHAPQTRTPSAQTRHSDRSISGNPDVAPSNGASRKPKEASSSPRAALANAMNRVNGRA